MSLIIAKPKLEKAIFDAFESAYNTSVRQPIPLEGVAAKIRKQLSFDLANAIHEYVIAAQVNISEVSSVVPPGVVVSAPPPAGAGATIAPGKAQHMGFGSLQ